jgi:hydroxymethylpyrimidine/phosphomethylpyrimidine kinase
LIISREPEPGACGPEPDRVEVSPSVLTVAGLDPTGGAGILADVRTFEALGAHGMAVVSSITYQNTQGVLGRLDLDHAVVTSQLDAVLSDVEPAATKTGVLGGADTIREVALMLGERDVTPVVVDPVIQSGDGKSLLGDGGLDAINEWLLPRAALVTPNVLELEALCGFDLFDLPDLKTGAFWLVKQGASAVLVTGWRMEEDGRKYSVDVLFDGKEYELFRSPWAEGLFVHGTGCVLSAAVTVYLGLGLGLREAVTRGRELVAAAIAGAVSLGKGAPCANPRAPTSR